jgi:signal transduction histidine kinase/ActR/RegA family two-component response regulator
MASAELRSDSAACPTIRNSVRQSITYRYGFAIVCTVAATWARCSLTPYLDDRAPFGTFFISIPVSAWVGGSGPAIVALLLGLVAAAHFIIPPHGSLPIQSLPDVFSLIVYFLVGVTSIGLFSKLATRTREAERHGNENSRLNDELQQSARRKDGFLAVLAHELRNPLAAVKSGVTLLSRLSGDDAECVRISTMLDRQIRQLSGLVNDLMDVSRHIRNDISLCCEDLPIRDVILNATDAVSGEMSRRRHRFEPPLPDESVWVHADRVRLTQIIVNLLMNAAKYTPDAGNIELRLTVREPWLTIEVRDNGIGIAPAFQPRVFDLFTQFEPVTTRQHGGLGLGLAIVKTLTTMHDGTAAVYSAGKGQGARFVVELPIVIRSESSVPDIGTSLPEDNRDKDRTTVHIVDDNVDAADTLAMLLELAGFRVRCSYDGRSGLQLIADEPPDYLILDIGLPERDGYEVARRVRMLPVGPQITIVACTGWGSVADIERSRVAGFDHHMVKSIDPDHLIEWLRTPEEERPSSTLSPGVADACF